MVTRQILGGWRYITAGAVVGVALLIAACDKESGGEDELSDADMGEMAEMGEAPLDVPIDDSCDLVGTSQPCADDTGTQFCFTNAELDRVWGECLPSYECVPGEQRECSLGGSVTCQLDGVGVPYFNECPFTPLVLSFDAGPVELLSNAAAFTMDSQGMCLNTDWPASHNPWLALDLDHNGFIDGGHELFGAGWVLPSGQCASDGFIALATLDSNADGILDASDPRFAELLVWRDDDGDKRSRPGELTRLADEGIEALELDAFVQEHCDGRSNCARERSRFRFQADGRVEFGELVDVHLPCR